MLNDKIELTSRTTLHGIACYNTFQYVETVDGGANHLANLLAIFKDEVVPLWIEWLSNQAVISCLSASVVAAGPAIPKDLALTADNVGLISGESLPANRVIVVTDYTEEYYQWGRGRKLYSGIPAANESDNCIDEALFLLIKAMATRLVANLVSGVQGEWQRVVRSKLTGDDYPVETSSVRPQVATLRGRTTRLCG